MEYRARYEHLWEKDPQEEDLSLQIINDEIIDDLVVSDLEGVKVTLVHPGFGLTTGTPFSEFIREEYHKQSIRLKEVLYAERDNA